MRAAPRSSRVPFFVFTMALIGLGLCILQPTHRTTVHAQTSLGDPIPNLTNLETQLFNAGFQQFIGTWDPRQGLGPDFIQDSCAACHASPVIGGNSTLKTTFFEAPNPNEGEIGATDRGAGDRIERDPFGRPLSNNGTFDQGDVNIPDANMLQKSRQILDELRRRSGERSRPTIELDYIERLLRRF